ncbi:hypothetical protein KAFR_0K01870 [Kazachstania africana CBS 2517]|uniref:Uncharacterized protein n=1 Tax=Kazachstania africana (strain ATCC 22294 / BCRC 22015 / CBS 2517 / CECT 1963 / NBRC 1671 / NRRL Y-8276) TaxID=1071382 RepID=H2B1P1_KAZAF|nr:hypothetical protein KAFR_0K01870 [Kazachstania africana CBS 2517]CCF60541.1 hypothetical protein KAFR_0K01870 [Kazachstania africana CBS 2517]
MAEQNSTHDFETSLNNMEPNMNIPSDPPEPSLSEQTTPQKTASNSELSSSAPRSIVGDIISNRSKKSSFPTSSPIFNNEKKAAQRNRTRQSRRETSTLQKRGGLDAMEKFIMESEQRDEMENLNLQAMNHSIPFDHITTLEEEQREQIELEDDDLLQFIEHREEYERELEQLLSEFSVT